MIRKNRLKSVLKGRKLTVFYILILVIFSMLIPFFRNLILKPVWPRVWAPLSTYQVLKIVFMNNLPNNVSDLSCVQKKPGFKKSELLDVQYCELQQRRKFEKASQLPAGNPFLPVLNETERCDLILLYVETSAILARARLSYFLIAGTLMGVYRHQGLIPWDDDIDIAANGSEWEMFRSALSCVEGYSLTVNANMHWKFFRKNSHFPFIDIFFYTEDETYIWSLTHYANKEIVHRKSDIFPLSMGQFEGILAPLPRDVKTVVQEEYNTEYCQSPSLIHKNSSTASVTKVLCSVLSNYYNMQNIQNV